MKILTDKFKLNSKKIVFDVYLSILNWKQDTRQFRNIQLSSNSNTG